MTELPSGTVTFLFTDIEGSTARWEHHLQAMQRALARHDTILRTAIEGHGGGIFKTVGDAFCAVFADAPAALAAALTAQRGLAVELWDVALGPIRVRMALHTGTPEMRGGDYFGPPLNRVARILSVGYGGQILLSQATAQLVRDLLPLATELLDLGEHRLKDLSRTEQIFQLIAADLPRDFAPLRTLDRRQHNLIPPRDALIGRERETAEIVALLRRPNVGLVTLTGPGGTGKTRLSLQVAVALLEGPIAGEPGFEDGVWFVELAPVGDPELVVPTIARTLGIAEVTGQPVYEALAAYLRGKQLLLVLDNFEQVVAAAPRLTELLRLAPRLKIMVSSREVLQLSGEHEYPVSPLALPDHRKVRPEELAAVPAVSLFVERAQAVRPGFTLTDETAPLVAEICRRLDGLPLAIELAAARVRMLAPGPLLQRLDQRLKVLTGGPRDRTERQQTLRGAIDWSYDLLESNEKQLFARLGVFTGGCEIEAVEQVCNAEGDLELDVFDGLASLASKSLLQRPVDDATEPRFSMFETIREYAQERLMVSGELDSLRATHAAYYLALAEAAAPELAGREQVRWLTRLDHEQDNLRAALAWSVAAEGDGTMGLRLARALWRFWEIRGFFTEGRRWLDTILTQSAAAELTLRADVLDAAGVLARHQGDFAQATALYDEALALLQTPLDVWAIVRVLSHTAAVAHDKGDYIGAEAAYSKALDTVRGIPPATSEQAQVQVQALNGLGKTYREQGRFEQAAAAYEQALALSRRYGNKKDEAQVLNNQGGLAHFRRHSTEAREYHQRALVLHRAIGDQPGEGTSLQNLGIVIQEMGEYGLASEYLLAALSIHQSTGNRREQLNVWVGLGALSHFLGDLHDAEQSLREGLRLCDEIGDQAGKAYVLANLGPVTRDLGDFAASERLLTDGLALAQMQGDRATASYFLSYLAQVMLDVGRPKEAVTQSSAALALRRELGLLTWTSADLATLAAAHLASREVESAVAYAREAISVLDSLTDEEAEYPQHDYFVCYQVLAAAGLEELALVVLRTACDYLMSRAAKIQDSALRQSYLERVPMNQALVMEARRVLGQTASSSLTDTSSLETCSGHG